MPSKDHTKHLSFHFPVHPAYMPAVKVVQQYQIYVHYTLDQFGRVEIEGYLVKPGMAKHIIKWQELEDEMKEAAENNSKQYRIPNGRGGGQVKQHGHDPYNDIHDQWKQEIKQKETYGY